MQKKWLLFFSLIWIQFGGWVGAQADDECPIQFVAINKPVVGALLQASNGSKTLILDSYLQGSHEDIIRQYLLTSKVSEDELKVLWLGEAEVSLVKGSVKVTRVNNVSALVDKSRSGKSDRLPRFVGAQTFDQMGSRHLLLQNVEGILIPEQGLTDDLNVQLPGISESAAGAAIRDRHKIKNAITVIHVVASLLKRKPNALDSLDKADFLANVDLVRQWIDVYLAVEVRLLDNESQNLMKSVRDDLEKMSKAQTTDLHGWEPNYEDLSVRLMNINQLVFSNEHPPWLEVTIP